MIPIIEKRTACESLIDYHETKVEKGEASFLHSNTLGPEFRDGKEGKELRDAYSYQLNLLHDQNEQVSRKAVTKNKFYHLSISLSPTDHLDKENLTKLAEAYLEKMEYTDRPYFAYEHFDQKFQHLHIVIPTLNLYHEKDFQYKDWNKSYSAARELEKEFGLFQIETELGASSGKSKQTSENMDHYSFHRSFFNKSTDEERKEMIKKYPELHLIKKDHPLKNVEVKQIIGNSSFYEIQSSLILSEKWDESKKMQLKRKVETAFDLSKTKEDFYLNLKNLGVYHRELFHQRSNRFELKYGLEGENFYCFADKLSSRFTLSKINAMETIKVNTFRDKQEKYLKSLLSKTLPSSKSLNDFESKLKTFGIETVWASNSGGIYGVSFHNKSVQNGEIFKGSELGFSIKTIQDQIAKNNTTQSQIPNKSTQSGQVSEKGEMDFLSKRIKSILFKSNSIETFEKNLQSSKIQILYSKNSGGIYGVSFQNNTVPNGKTFKGSDLGVSYTAIKKHFSLKEEQSKSKSIGQPFAEEKKPIVSEKPTTLENKELKELTSDIASIVTAPVSMSSTGDFEEDKIKRRRKKSEREDDQDKGKDGISM
jgi:hypothetical protein